MYEWRVLMETVGMNKFTLGLFAFNEGAAKTKAKKLSQGCKVLEIVEVPEKVW